MLSKVQRGDHWVIQLEELDWPLFVTDQEPEADAYLATLQAVKADDVVAAWQGDLVINQPSAAVKAVSQEGDFLLIEGPLVTFGERQQADFRGDFFKADTEFALDWFDKRPVLFNHGLDPTMSITKIGDIISLEARDEEVWAKAQLDMRKRYMKKVKQWIEQGLMGWSSGTLAHLMKSVNGHIKRWPIVEGSLTLTPMDPRNLGTVTSIKSFATALTDQPLLGATSQGASTETELGEDGTASSGVVVGETSTTDTQEEDNEMNLQDMIASFVGQVSQQLGRKFSDAEIAGLIKSIGDSFTVEVPAGQTEEQVVEDTLADEAKVEQLVAATVKAITDLDASNKQRQAKIGDAVKAAVGKNFKDAIPRSQAGSVTGVKGFVAGQAPMVNFRAKMRSRYSNLDGEDMAYLKSFLDGMHRHKYGQPYEPEADFWVELADRFDSEEISGLPPQAVKAFQAIKSDELDNTGAVAAGAEWVPELWLNQVWARSRMENVVAPLFQTIQMPSQTYNLPIESTDPTVYKVLETADENTLALDISTSPIPDSVLATGKVQLVADKLALRVGYSSEQDEESIIPFAAQARAQAQRAIMDAIDNVLINADSATVNNINYDGGTPNATSKYMVGFPGLLKLPLVTNTAMKLDAGGAAPTLAMVRATRALLPNHYATRINDLAYLCDFSTYMKLLAIPEILTVDKYGSRATVMTGEVGKIDGIPVLVTNEMALADSDGKITYNGNTVNRGRLLLAYRPGWYIGYRRQVTVNVEYLSFFDAYQMTATVRPAFARRDTQVAALLYNIGVG